RGPAEPAPASPAAGVLLRTCSFPVAARTAALDLATLALALDPALLRGAGGAGRDAPLRHRQAGGNEGRQALARILAVALLGAEALRIDHQHAVVGQAPVAPCQQPLAQGLGQGRGTGDVEPQLDGGGNLVDVLPAGAAGAHEPLDDLRLRDRQVGTDAEYVDGHGRIVSGRRPAARTQPPSAASPGRLQPNSAIALRNSPEGGATTVIRRPSRGCGKPSCQACSSIRCTPRMRKARLWRPSPWLVSPMRWCEACLRCRRIWRKRPVTGAHSSSA